jgi:hypothetical protein
MRTKRETDSPETMRRADYEREKFPDVTLSHSEHAVFIPENDADSNLDEESTHRDDLTSEKDYRDTGGRVVLSVTYYHADPGASLDTWPGSKS